jgi:hypothetical protein
LVCVTKEGLDGEATVNPDISIADNSVILESMKNLCTGIGSLDLNKIHQIDDLPDGIMKAASLRGTIELNKPQIMAERLCH